MLFALLAVGALLILAGPVWVAVRWPHGERPTAHLGVFVLLVALMVAAVALSMRIAPPLGALMALVLGITSVLVARQLLSRERRLADMLDGLDDERSRPSSLAALHAYFVTMQSRRWGSALLVGHALRAADRLAEVRCLSEAVELLEGIATDRIPSAFLQTWRNNLAVYRMRAGDLQGARAALDSIDVSKVRRFAHVLEANRTLLVALEGRHREALERLGEQVPAEPADRTWHIARAHALAGLGDSDGCREALRRLVRDHGAEVLGRLDQPTGPATPIAAAMAAAADAPYR